MTESGALVQWGNATTHNLETVLHANVMSSRYSRGLEQLEFNELVDEIYSNVRGCAPPAGQLCAQPAAFWKLEDGSSSPPARSCGVTPDALHTRACPAGDTRRAVDVG